MRKSMLLTPADQGIRSSLRARVCLVVSGRYVPNTTAVGTFRNSEDRGITLALVHSDTPRGLRTCEAETAW